MSRARIFAVSVLLLFATAAAAEDLQPAPSMQQPANSYAPLIERTAPAVVNIYARKIVRGRGAARFLDGSAFWRLFRDSLLFGYGQDRIENSLGSGVIVTKDGVIVTNHHVIADAEGIQVALADGLVYGAAVLVSDPRTDVAVLRITSESALPYIEFGDSDGLKVGDPVIAIGNPFGLGQTVTSGIVSALARTTFGVTDFRFFIQTDAAINPGNSGGAQIDLNGKLIGINTAIYSTTGGSQGVGFAIPSNMVRPIVESAIEGRPLVHPWIGISGRRIPPQFAQALGLSGGHGVIVTDVYKRSPADGAGFVPGDVIIGVDDDRVDDPEALRYRIAMQRPSATVKITAVRGGQRYLVPVTAIAPPAEPARNETWLASLSPLRGAKVASLSPAFAEEIGADSGLSGVVVLDVSQGSAAARLGLRAGDIIRRLDDRDISTVAELLQFRVVPFRPWRMMVSRTGSNLEIRRPKEVNFTP